MSTRTTDAFIDPKNEQIVLQRVNPDGTQLATYGSIVMALGDCLGSDGTYHHLAIREVCVVVGGVNKSMLVVGSEPFTPGS
jgi:hypothetical protein